MRQNQSPEHELDEELPLSESTFWIVLSLAAGAKHGYAILKDVAELSEQHSVLSTGTLYGVLKRLLAAGWIERVDEPSPDDTTRTPKAYKLTDLGRRVLGAETARLRRLLHAAQRQAAVEGL